jgi:hypothetical protein
VQNFAKSITDYKVRCLPEIWRQDAVGNAVWSRSALVKKRRAVERIPKKRRKIKSFNIFLVDILGIFFSSRSKI